MSDVFRTIMRGLVLVAGLFTIYLVINTVVNTVHDSAQTMRDNAASTRIIMSTVSKEPFGNQVSTVKRGDQIFYNITIKRTEGFPCFVQTSWRWTLLLPTGNSVMWNTDDGQYYTGDKNENLAQAISVPEKLIPGQYILSRLSVFKCGNVLDYAKTVRNTNLTVE